MNIGSLILNGIQQGLASAFSALGGAFSAIENAASSTAKVLTGSLAAAISALSLIAIKAVSNLNALGASLRDLSASTGIAIAQSSVLLARFKTLGVDAGQMFGGQNATMFGMRAAAHGLPTYTDPNFAAATAGRFQDLQSQGMIGQTMAQQLLRSLGLDNDQGRKLVSTPVESINQQMSFQGRIQSTLGVDPEMISRVTQQFELLTNQLQVLASAALTRLAAEVLPYVNERLGQLVSFIEANAPQIGEWITAGVEMAINAGQALGSWLLNDLPPMLINAARVGLEAFGSMTHGVADFAHTIASFLRAFQQGNNGFAEMIGNFLEGIDWISTGFSGLMRTLGLLGTAIYDVAAAIINHVGGMFNFIKDTMMVSARPILNAFGQQDTVKAIDNFRVPTMPLYNPLDALDPKLFPTSDLRGSFENFRNSPGITDAANGLDNLGSKLEKFADGAVVSGNQKIDAAESFYQKILGQLGKLDNIDRNTAATAQNTNRTANNTADTWSQITQRIDRVIAYQNENRVLNITRISG